MNERDFDARFQEMAERQKASEAKFSGLKAFALQAFSVGVGFLFVSVLFSIGVQLISIGLGFSVSVLNAFIVGVGLSVLQLAHSSLTWARR